MGGWADVCVCVCARVCGCVSFSSSLWMLELGNATSALAHLLTYINTMSTLASPCVKARVAPPQAWSVTWGLAKVARVTGDVCQKWCLFHRFIAEGDLMLTPITTLLVGF